MGALPKRGKAAIWAEIQGQGTEVLWGRSAYKKSHRGRHPGHSKDRYYGDDTRKIWKKRRSNALRRAVVADAQEALRCSFTLSQLATSGSHPVPPRLLLEA